MGEPDYCDEDALVEALRREAMHHHKRSGLVIQPLTEQQVQNAEKRLGFRLPPLVRRLYLEVGNGEFGPGLLPLIYKGGTRLSNSARSVAGAYCQMRRSREISSFEDMLLPHLHLPRCQWWEKLLLVCDWGCSIFIYVDCSKPDLPVYVADNGCFELKASSLREWLTDWVETWAAPDRGADLGV